MPTLQLITPSAANPDVRLEAHPAAPLEANFNAHLSATANAPLVAPHIFTRHLSDRSFIGQDVLEVTPGELWMFTNYGRKPTDFSPADLECHAPPIWKSRDGGRTWGEAAPMPMEWPIDGWLSDGGRSVLRLQSGRLIFVSHRYSGHFKRTGSHGIPVQSVSENDGITWSPARLLVEQDDIFYVMNQRLIQIISGPHRGRLVLPVSGRDPRVPVEQYGEGSDPCVSRCFLSDDEGVTWRLGRGTVLEPTQRGAQEPCVAEVASGGLVMIYRSGHGSHQRCYSSDGGETWSPPESTGLQAACSPLTLVTLRGGHLLLAYNPAKPQFKESYFPRNPLAYTTSGDGGLTWTPPVVVDRQPHQQLIYPSVTQTDEGLLFVYCAFLDPGDGNFNFDKSAYNLGGGKVCLMPYPVDQD